MMHHIHRYSRNLWNQQYTHLAKSYRIREMHELVVWEN